MHLIQFISQNQLSMPYGYMRIPVLWDQQSQHHISVLVIQHILNITLFVVITHARLVRPLTLVHHAPLILLGLMKTVHFHALAAKDIMIQV